MWAIEWSRDRWRHVTLKGQTRSPNSLKAQYLENYLSYKLPIWYAALYGEFRAGARKISPKSGRGLSHVAPKIFGIGSAILATAWLLVYIAYFQCIPIQLLHHKSWTSFAARRTSRLTVSPAPVIQLNFTVYCQYKFNQNWGAPCPCISLGQLWRQKQRRPISGKR